MCTSKNSFLSAVEQFQASHRKIYLRRKRQNIRLAYRALKQLCRRSGARCGVRWDSESVSIRIVCPHFLVTDEDPRVQWLFSSAALQQYEAHGRRITIDLWFCCWKWLSDTPSFGPSQAENTAKSL